MSKPNYDWSSFMKPMDWNAANVNPQPPASKSKNRKFKTKSKPNPNPQPQSPTPTPTPTPTPQPQSKPTPTPPIKIPTRSHNKSKTKSKPKPTPIPTPPIKIPTRSKSNSKSNSKSHDSIQLNSSLEHRIYELLTKSSVSPEENQILDNLREAYQQYKTAKDQYTKAKQQQLRSPSKVYRSAQTKEDLVNKMKQLEKDIALVSNQLVEQKQLEKFYYNKLSSFRIVSKLFGSKMNENEIKYQSAKDTGTVLSKRLTLMHNTMVNLKTTIKKIEGEVDEIKDAQAMKNEIERTRLLLVEMVKKVQNIVKQYDAFNQRKMLAEIYANTPNLADAMSSEIV